MSSDTQSLSKNTKHFKFLCSLMYEDTIPFKVYRSKITGITVCIAEVDGPFIDGDFNIVTETCDNDGLPYAVEHLIFTGTKDYPYNNILQLWANRSLGSPIAATTLQDRTCFTMRAAGSEGFLNLMPQYLDHILYPSLENSAYLIKVHHINDKGSHGGVVYCTTRIEERTSNYIITKKMLRALYPGNCGYNSIIIGTTKNLRESTSIEKVKQFHEKFYKPENLTILITGKIQPNKLFQALLPLEKKILSKKRKDIFERPWQTRIKPLTKNVDVEVFFPSDTEIYGEVHVAWRGPSLTRQVNDCNDCFLLLIYLTDTSSSPFTKEYSEISDDCFITRFTTNWSDPYLRIIFKNVPIKQIDLITQQSIHNVLRNLYTEGINMTTMKTLINKSIFNYRCDVENNPHRSISSLVFEHVMYENTDFVPKLEKRLNMIRHYEKLKDKSETYFSNLLKNYFVDAPMVVVRGKPSMDMYFKLQDEEKNVTEQNKTLGQKYLKQKKKELQEARNETNKNVPYKDLWEVPIPGINSITFHHIERYNTETANQHPNLDVTKLPFFTYLDDVNTNFYYLHVIMNTSSINLEDKLYIPLLMEVITEFPIKEGDQLISYEKEKDLLIVDNIKVQYHIDNILSRHLSYNISLMLQAELHNYEKSVQWCKELLYDTKLTAENLKVVITQLLNNITYSGETLAGILLNTLLYTDVNKQFPYNVLRQYTFLCDVQERLDTDEGQKEVMAKIECVRQTLTLPKNMFVHMAVNVNKLTEQFPDVYDPWIKCFSTFMNLEKTKMNITSNLKILTPSNTYNGCIMGLDWIKSSLFIQICPCIDDFKHSDLPALEVCLIYFRQKEGPIWKETRETRERQALLDYFGIFTTINDGYLSLELISSTNVIAAYKKTQSIVKTHLKGETEWDSYLYEKAKSSAILHYINNVQTISHVIHASLTSYCKNLPHDYNYEMVQRISAVTKDDMIRVTKYIISLFDPEQCKIAIVCNNDKFAEIKEAFQNMKFNFNVFKSLNKLKDYIENRTTN